MSEKAKENAAIKRDEDLAFLSTYISTEAGATGQTNADVLGRLLVDAHARLDELLREEDKITEHWNQRLDELQRKFEHVANSLEKVVAPKLHDLRQLPEMVENMNRRVELLTSGLEKLTAVVEKMDAGELPEGVKRDLG